MQLSYIKTAGAPEGDAGDPYNGYDRFGRTIDMRWVTTSGGAVRDRIQYGYDRASNRTWRKNLAASSDQDEAYEYDGLYQLKDFARGNLNLNQTEIGAIPVAEETFAYDPTGNWTNYTRAANGSITLDQTRVNNRDNQITQIDGSSSGISHDAAGNTTQMPPDESGDWDDSHTLTWDAWNRLVKVEEGQTEIATYAYDGLYRRITKTVGGTTRHIYYTDRWKPLEERIDSSTDAERQYIWGARPEHRDELILRDRDTDSNGSLDERLYCAMDYYSPTSMLNTSGEVQERYGFTGFGRRRIMDASFDPINSSAFDVDFAFHGQFLDAETGYYDYGYRLYSPQIGRWLSRDPIEEDGGANLYGFVGNRPQVFLDLLGFETIKDTVKFPVVYNIRRAAIRGHDNTLHTWIEPRVVETEVTVEYEATWNADGYPKSLSFEKAYFTKSKKKGKKHTIKVPKAKGVQLNVGVWLEVDPLPTETLNKGRLMRKSVHLIVKSGDSINVFGIQLGEDRTLGDWFSMVEIKCCK